MVYTSKHHVLFLHFFQNPDDLCFIQSIKLLQLNIPAVVVNGLAQPNVSDFDVKLLPLNGQNQVATSFLLIARLYWGIKVCILNMVAAKIIKKSC